MEWKIMLETKHENKVENEFRVSELTEKDANERMDWMIESSLDNFREVFEDVSVNGHTIFGKTYFLDGCDYSFRLYTIPVELA